jgi:type IV secretion system protein VirD4
MFSLPRGAGVSVDSPLASAAWQSPDVTEQLVYPGGGALFVGAIPASEHWPLLSRLYQQGGAIAATIARSNLPPLQRAERIKALEQQWRAALLADAIPLGLNDDRHFVTIAGSRSGKGTSAIIPNLCIYPGSVICLDPKGENASLTAARRGSGADGSEGLGQDVYVLDLFGAADVPDALRAGFNPLALLDPESHTVVDDANLLAEGLIVAKNEKDSHWDESAQNFLKGLILHLITRLENPSLLTLRRYLTQGDREGWDEACMACADEDALEKFLALTPSPSAHLLQSMRDNDAFSGIIAGAAETLLACSDNERGGILSTARRNTSFLDSLDPRFIETLEGGGRTFSPDIFKTAPKGATLYLCLPAERMGTHGRWLRIMISLLLERAYRDLAPPACGAPILFLLEEFHSLGHMTVIEKAAGYAAGFGVKLWAVLQDLGQLKALYPQSWATFLANAGAIQVFGVSDPDTTAYVSKALGEVEVIRHLSNRSNNYQSGESTPSMNQKAGGLFTAAGGFSALRLALSALPDAGQSESQSMSETVAQQLQIVPLLRPDEIAIQFARETGAALLLVKGRQPIWTLRVDFFSSDWFAGLFTSKPQGAARAKRRGLHERTPEALQKIAALFERMTAEFEARRAAARRA